MAKVSVIIPTYNRAGYLRESIASALAQTFQDFELIILDDGSTDETRAVVESFRDPRLKYVFQKENGGVAVAMNAGVQHSVGEYFAVLGDDDKWMPRMLEEQLAILEQDDGLAFVCGAMDIIDPEGRVIRTSTDGRQRATTLESLLEDNFVWHLTALVRRRYFDEAGGFDPDLPTTQDYDLWLRLAKRYRFAYNPSVLGQWRCHAGNTSKKLDRWLRDHHACMFRPGITAGLPLWKIQRYRAGVYYKFGRFYAAEKLWGRAARCFFFSVVHLPVIGLWFWPPETENFRFTLPYRLLYPYGIIPVYLYKSFFSRTRHAS